MKLMGTASLEEVPRSFRGSLKAKKKYLMRLSLLIMDQIWNPPSDEDLNLATESLKPDPRGGEEEPFAYCKCRNGKYNLV